MANRVNWGVLSTAKIGREKVLPAMYVLRDVCDRIEMAVGNAYWPLPKYREMLFCY